MSQADNEKLKKSRPGETPEETERGLTGGPGLYRHPQSGQEVHVLYDPLYGNAQAEAALRVGFEFVRESKPEEIKTIVSGTDQEKGAATVGAVLGGTTAEDVKGIQARLTALEKEKDARIAELEAQLAAKNGTEQPDTEAEAKAQTEARNDGKPAVGGTDPNEGLQTGGLASQSSATEGDKKSEKPLGSQNSTELKETATKEGVEITPDLDTNKKLAAAIQAKRDEKAAKEGDKE